MNVQKVSQGSLKFGVMTLNQQKRIAKARNGGELPKIEKILFSLASETAVSLPEIPEVEAKKIVKELKNIGYWGMLDGGPPDWHIQKTSHTLDHINQLLQSIPYLVTENVVKGLENAYKKSVSLIE